MFNVGQNVIFLYIGFVLILEPKAWALRCQQCVFERVTSTVPAVQLQYTHLTQGDLTCLDGVVSATECSELNNRDDFECRRERKEILLTKMVNGVEENTVYTYVTRGCTGYTEYPGFGDNKCRDKESMIRNDYLTTAQANSVLSNLTVDTIWPGSTVQYDNYEFCLCDYDDCNSAPKFNNLGIAVVSSYYLIRAFM